MTIVLTSPVLSAPSSAVEAKFMIAVESFLLMALDSDKKDFNPKIPKSAATTT